MHSPAPGQWPTAVQGLALGFGSGVVGSLEWAKIQVGGGGPDRPPHLPRRSGPTSGGTQMRTFALPPWGWVPTRGVALCSVVPAHSRHTPREGGSVWTLVPVDPGRFPLKWELFAPPHYIKKQTVYLDQGAGGGPLNPFANQDWGD